MSGFTAAALESLDYDFTGIPCAEQPKPTESDPKPAIVYCTGKGIVPEPTPAQLEAFFRFGRDQGRKGAGVAAALAEGEDVTLSLEETARGLRAALAAVCSGHPSEAELTELPFRALRLFSDWLVGELAPKG